MVHDGMVHDGMGHQCMDQECTGQDCEPLNVVCLKWGQLYGPEYVNKLYGMVSRNISRPFRFICFTEASKGLRDEVEVQPLPEFPEPPWEYARYCSAWRKLALFRAGLADMQGRVLFLDLDLLILSSLDEMLMRTEPFLMIENWYQAQQRKGQASVMLFDAGYPEFLLLRYLDDPLKVLNQCQTEQEYISTFLPAEQAIFFPESWCKSFKKHVMLNIWQRLIGEKYPEPRDAGFIDTKILVFHGRPNPPDALIGEWGKPMPGWKRWLKGLRPCPWIADFWRE
jgi:hypothetical protein